MPTDQSCDMVNLVDEWIHQLGVTEPGEPWWENLVDALVGLGKPAVLLLVDHMSDENRAVSLGTSKAIERIARALRQEQERNRSGCHHVFQLWKFRTS